MPVPNDGFSHPESYQSRQLREIRQARYDNSLNYSFLNLYAAQNYGNPGNVSTAEASIDREFGLDPPLFRSETIQDFRSNYQPGHRAVTIPQKPHLPNPKEHVIYQPVEKTEQVSTPPEVKYEEKYEPVSYEVPNEEVEIPEDFILPPPPPVPGLEEPEVPDLSRFLIGDLEKQAIPQYPRSSTAFGIPQFKNLEKGTESQLINILGSYYGLPKKRDRNSLIAELNNRQKILKHRARIEGAPYPQKKDFVPLKGYVSNKAGRQIGHGIDRSTFFRDLLSSPSKEQINFARSQGNTARDFADYNRRKTGGAMSNRRKILAGEIGAGNDNPEVRRMLKQMGAMKLRKVPISAY